jgi:hypothetical protein
MGDLFGDLRSGIQFPQVVMNQGPLPSAGGLPQPLHESADARINYNSTLLGDLTPYAYGEPGYLSSQNAYLNIPHKIQKIVPVVFLPEAKPGAKDFFDLSHPIDDGDLAFVLRLNRSSLFCTGLKNGDMRRAGLGTAIDPLINLCTFNYILSGMQLGLTHRPGSGDLWEELLFNLDPHRFGKPLGLNSRNYSLNPIGLDDIIHMVHHCIRPFGITRGSEKQGGQDESTLSPATWPVSFVVSLTIDGKESNVVNLWHNHELHAGNDLILRLKLMPLRPYTLNHYYKGVKRQTWSLPDSATRYVWQIVPDLLHLDMPTEKEQVVLAAQLATLPPQFRRLKGYRVGQGGTGFQVDEGTPWQDLGYWHIGRSQIMTGKYGVEEYWHNDLANSLRTNHLDITFQPSFCSTPFMRYTNNNGPRQELFTLGRAADGGDRPFTVPASARQTSSSAGWAPALGLEQMIAPPGDHDHALASTSSMLEGGQVDGDGMFPWEACLGLHQPAGEASLNGGAIADEEDIGTLDFTDDISSLMVPPPSTSHVPVQEDVSTGSGKKPSVGSRPGKRGKTGGGSLLKMDGTSEASAVDIL